jgi:CheY-like chemotaxis protein
MTFLVAASRLILRRRSGIWFAQFGERIVLCPACDVGPQAGVVPHEQAAMMIREQFASSSSRSLRVLIAEDNPDGRATLCALLMLLGYTVETAEDGQGAIEKALASRPEVVFIDIGLPRLNGYQVAQQLRAALGSDVFLIAYTAYNQPEDRRRAFAAGIDAYLVKPVDVAELEHWLDVARKRQRRTSD